MGQLPLSSCERRGSVTSALRAANALLSTRLHAHRFALTPELCLLSSSCLSLQCDDPAVKHFAGQKWAQPSLSHLRELMRYVVTHREEAKEKGRAARRHLQANFSPEIVAGLTRALIDQVGRG